MEGVERKIFFALLASALGGTGGGGVGREGVSWGVGLGGVRMDVNEELKIQK